MTQRMRELRVRNMRSRILSELQQIGLRVQEECILALSLSFDPAEIVTHSDIRISFQADGMRVSNVDVVVHKFIETLYTYIINKKDHKAFWLSLPMESFWFTVELSSRQLLDNAHDIINKFHKVSESYSKEIMVCDDTCASSGVGLFVEEHRYYIASWLKAPK